MFNVNLVPKFELKTNIRDIFPQINFMYALSQFQLIIARKHLNNNYVYFSKMIKKKKKMLTSTKSLNRIFNTAQERLNI